MDNKNENNNTTSNSNQNPSLREGHRVGSLREGHRVGAISMTSGSPVRHILQFALPLILGYILQQVYLVTDAAIVGRFLGVN